MTRRSTTFDNYSPIDQRRLADQSLYCQSIGLPVRDSASENSSLNNTRIRSQQRAIGLAGNWTGLPTMELPSRHYDSITDLKILTIWPTHIEGMRGSLPSA